jgi:hypothetical protein
MKSEEDLRGYYEKELIPSLIDLESMRKKTLMNIAAFTVAMLLAAVFVVAAALGVFVFARPCSITFCCLPLAPMLWIVAYFLGFSRLASPYRGNYKMQVMPKIVKFVDEGLEYDPKRGIPYDEFMRSGIFQVKPDVYTGEDCVFGTIGKTKIEFSEVLAQEKQESEDSDGHRSTNYVTIFRGIFLVADFNKSFKQKTLVLPDTAEKMFGKLIGGFIQSKNITRPPLVKMEDPEFEKFFVVYGQDQVEARYVLSTSLMQRITEYRKKTGKALFLSFVDDKLMVAIPFKGNQFEPGLFHSLVDFERIRQFHSVLQLVAGIVEDLNLNTRIWGKQ